jgi:hypothetical protein
MLRSNALGQTRGTNAKLAVNPSTGAIFDGKGRVAITTWKTEVFFVFDITRRRHGSGGHRDFKTLVSDFDNRTDVQIRLFHDHTFQEGLAITRTHQGTAFVRTQTKGHQHFAAILIPAANTQGFGLWKVDNDQITGMLIYFLIRHRQFVPMARWW